MPNGPWIYMSTMYFVGVMPSRAGAYTCSLLGSA